MEPVGMTKASTTKARKTKAKTKAMTSDSMVSLNDWAVVLVAVVRLVWSGLFGRIL